MGDAGGMILTVSAIVSIPLPSTLSSLVLIVCRVSVGWMISVSVLEPLSATQIIT